ncbi:MAG: GGDEF domain-containing protein [Rubrivivax sp.]|nr:GGDEF domain-containing protein [Rubrivivax sp.]
MQNPNKYPESPAKCAEILRVALPQMTRQSAGAHPVSYAVWFDHTSGRNPRLSEALAGATAGGKVLDEATTWKLYHEFVADADEQAAQRVADGIRRVMKEMAESAKAAGAQTDVFGDSLSRFADSVERGEAPDGDVLTQVLAQTQEMRSAVGQLRNRLEASQQEIEKLRSEVDRARTEAMVDVLTGLPNRRAFEQALQSSLSRPDEPACLLMADIDHFKKINDSYGHLFGDTVLKLVAQALRNSLSAPQMAARVGGEEFAILTPGMDLAGAAALAERIRATIAGSRIRRKDSAEPIGQITLSLGVARLQAGEDAEDWFERADRALYTSKAGGRNRVTLADNAGPQTAAPEVTA